MKMKLGITNVFTAIVSPHLRAYESSVQGGGSVRINVWRRLLYPTKETDVFGKTVLMLGFNGITVYLPAECGISIGSAKGCNIRIVDKMVEEVPLSIRGLSLFNYGKKKIAIKNRLTHEITEISGSYCIDSDCSIFIELSGIGKNGGPRLLEIKARIPGYEPLK